MIEKIANWCLEGLALLIAALALARTPRPPKRKSNRKGRHRR